MFEKDGGAGRALAQVLLDPAAELRRGHGAGVCAAGDDDDRHPVRLVLALIVEGRQALHARDRLRRLARELLEVLSRDGATAVLDRARPALDGRLDEFCVRAAARRLRVEHAVNEGNRRPKGVDLHSRDVAARAAARLIGGDDVVLADGRHHAVYAVAEEHLPEGAVNRVEAVGRVRFGQVVGRVPADVEPRDVARVVRRRANVVGTRFDEALSLALGEGVEFVHPNLLLDDRKLRERVLLVGYSSA